MHAMGDEGEAESRRVAAASSVATVKMISRM
jgi:hypothetical protein